MKPPHSKEIFSRPFFEVAPPHEPYYNPANLEKVSIRVKEKEFIHQIGGARRSHYAAHQRSSAARGHFVFSPAFVGGAGPRRSAAHQEPLPVVHRSRRASAATRALPSPRAWIESAGDRGCVEASRRRCSAR